MGLLSRIIDFIKNNKVTDKKSRYIFYKIVDLRNEESKLILQCIKTSAFFNSSILEIVFDKTLLHALHPAQACFVGIEYVASWRELNLSSSAEHDNKKMKLDNYTDPRYGSYKLCYQDRKGNICFSHQETDKVFLMDPRDIASSEDLIQEFDAAQAFYIGVFAGYAAMKKMNMPKSR